MASSPGPGTDPQFWAGKRVLVTGHTGFKGTWLTLWLQQLGAEVVGLSLPPPTKPSMFELVGGTDAVETMIGDVAEPAAMAEAIKAANPEVIFHLAAQVLVRQSYADPMETVRSNVLGTANLLNEAKDHPGLQAIVVVTSDKCYENQEWPWAYREHEPMGGHDPYSASKGCAELITSSMRRSFYHEPGAALIGTARAGNVIGGGDWATDRLIPDIVRAFTASEPVTIRMPEAIRPWQHVLEPLGGYLVLAQRLGQGEREVADGWNFGPSPDDVRPVGWIVEQMAKRWGDGAGFEIVRGGPHEAMYLKLDCSKAETKLGWRPRLRLDQALEWVTDWYRAHVDGADVRALSLDQISAFGSMTPDLD